jgi:hypothetical protein
VNARLARQILRSYRPSGADDQERDVREALKMGEKNAELGGEFQDQLAFDRAVAARLVEKPLPEEVASALEEAADRVEAGRCRRFTLRDPAMLAVGLAFLFLVGLVTWIVLGKMSSFAGVQEISEMVSTGSQVGPDRYTEMETRAGLLKDWFVMQDFEGFVVPPELEDSPVAGVRLFQFNDEPVAAIAVTGPPGLLYVFAAHPLGLSLPDGRWQIAPYGPGRKRFFAVRQIGTMAFVVALRSGGEAELKKFLAEHGAPH